MIKEAIATGETVELAKEAACRELGVESYEAEFEILEMPTKKTFGLFGGNPAKVRVFIKNDPAEAAAKYLKGILDKMGLSAVDIQIKEEENGAQLSLSGDDIGFIIGHRGETLDALQYLTGLVANHIDNSYYRITIDIGNYREKRRETLEILGKKIAAKAIKTGRNSSLEPMNPYERRIIHTAVQTVEGAKSWSEGEDLSRHVVIGPEAGERPAPRRNNYGKGQGRRPYNDKPRSGGYNNRQPRSAPNVGPGPNVGSGPSAGSVPGAGSVPARQPVQKAAPKNEGKAPLYGRVDVKK
ncbi:RNA-binding cell elongation regulator Jag/EloR [Clostridium sp. KNHs216]|uniref:RNA-binding cell elongation regulator Jag/EloR n=1 Tax=Clostridium sp. KNHs216 TaxID=1550235 RepID=UPI00114D6BC2|nr:RNA-binding cell elongation regulator Jag/EloR [Clostridium sp. KNHs216]TQI67617.1 spoIIIJ-associated protein [Clostridium sp. KNHs216]